MSNTITGMVMFVLFLGMVFTGLMYIVPHTDWYSNLPEKVELNCTGNVIDIEFLGGGFNGLPNTLVRFDNGDTILFRHHKTEIPLNKEIKFYYIDNGFGYLFLDRFEVVK